MISAVPALGVSAGHSAPSALLPSPSQPSLSCSRPGGSPQQDPHLVSEALCTMSDSTWSNHTTPLCRDDITIARSAQGKKMRIGEGGTGTVYKALMHSCDEVAVKVVRTAQPTLQEASEFHKVRALQAVWGWCRTVARGLRP